MTAAPVGPHDSIQAAFKEAFTRFAATVSVISYTALGSVPAGMTATSMCSLSLDPLSLLVCMNRLAKSHSEILAAGRFGVNMLSSGQRDAAEYCSRPGAIKRLPDEWLLAGDGTARSPVLAHGVAHLDCRLVRTYTEPTHSILIGEVERVWIGPKAEPLLYCNRVYRRFDDEGDTEAMLRVWDRVAFGALS
jgi:flavin reductase (DIM6/NTAB) family NADH-FMN oxidoreductase RutF